jgi:ATP-binding cassette subfamily B protein
MQQWREWPQQTQRVLHLLRWSFQLLWQSHRVGTVVVSLLALAQAVIPLAQLWVTKRLVDQMALILRLPLPQRSEEIIGEIWIYVGLEALLLLGGLLLSMAAGHWRTILQEHLAYHVQLQVVAKSAQLDLAAYESPVYYDQLHRVQENALYGPIQLLNAVLELSQTLLSLVSVSILVLFYQPWVAAVLVLTTLPSFWALLYYGRQRFLLFDRRTADGRRAEYLTTILTSDAYAKEVRVWGLTHYLTDQIKTLRARFKQENIALSRGQTIATLGGELLAALGYYSAYITVVSAVIAGRLSLGDLTLYAGVFARTQSVVEALLRAVAEMYEIQLFAEQLEIFLSWHPTVVAPTNPQAVPALKTGIEVQNLSFTYPGTDRLALRNVSFTIQPGQCVAVVGLNGAGKTSLVKCLLRLYDPDQGRILADGRDLRDLDPDAWRRQVGVVFQDYARYQFTARENIGFGDVDTLADPVRIRQAAQAAGIDSLLSNLPAGYETLLGRRFEGGAELSLGQWQRVALARALLRDAPLLVLDEPTAAMDPEAEFELYQHFRTLAKDRMTLLISHRFSTVRMADLILVLAEGTIIEKGTHDELLAQNGQYARLFNLQAESYQRTAPAAPREWSNGNDGNYVVEQSVA